MTGSDLLVLAPWVVFGAGLIVVYLRLRRSRRSSRSEPQRGADDRG
jgi:Flp pilus assembly protein TadB